MGLALENIEKPVEILGVPVWGMDRSTFVERARQCILKREKVLFTTTNAHSIVVAQKNPGFLTHFKEADLVLPDGILPVWAGRSLGKVMTERVAGPDFVDHFMAMAEQENFRIFFMGSTDETLEKLSKNLLDRRPNLKIVGLLAPPFGDWDEKTDQALVDAINEAKPDALFVGMTAPKQELWLSKNFSRLELPFSIGVGAAFNFLAGEKRRAPDWVGRMGMEWFYRLVQEPGRMWRRNIDSAVFIWLFTANHGRDVVERLVNKNGKAD